MGFTPWPVGDRQPWTFELEPDSGDFDVAGLTPADFSLIFVNEANDTPRTGNGVFSSLQQAVSGNPAQITYTPSAADVATAGSFDTRVVSKAGTASQKTFFLGTWECIA